MKNLIKLCFLISLLFCACKRSELPVLSISEKNIEVSAEANTVNISLTANNLWTATGSDWCKVTPSSGDGIETNVEIQISENDTYAERSCKVIFKSGDLTATLDIKQAANLGVVLPEKEYKISSKAQQLEVEVKSNVKYTVDINVNWISQLNTKALETTTLLFEIAENSTYDPRQGIINIIEENNRDTISIEVNQVAADAILVSPAEFDLTCDAHTLKLEVQTNVVLDVVIPEDAKDWVSHVETKSLETKSITLQISANSGYDSRSCQVKIKKKDGDYYETVSISQAESKGLEVSEKEFNISPQAQTLDIKFKANAPVVCTIAEEGSGWISVAQTKALEDGTITLSIKENTTYDIRESNVYINIERSNSVDTIKIIQKHKDTLFVNQNIYDVPKEGQTITITLKTSMEYNIVVKDAWITEVPTKSLDTKTHSFTISANEEVQGRSGEIVFESKSTGYSAKVTVNQNGSGGYIWYNGIVASKSVPGSGTESNPYIINTANDLQWLIDQTNASTQDDIKTAGKYYKLTHDIEIDSEEGRGWTPIGMGTDDSFLFGTPNVFSGHFDGGGHTITGKMVPVSQLSNSGNLYFGFFGFCKAFSESGNDLPYDYLPTIKNLNMTATVIVPSISAEFNSAYIGALVGYSHTAIEIANCKNSGSVTGFETGAEKKDVYMAGLMGLSEYNVTITDCENTGDINGGTATGKWSETWTAGVVGGATNITAKNVSNKGKVYGAAGYNSNTGGVFADISVLLLEKVNNYATVNGGNAVSAASTGGIASEAMYSYSGNSYIKECHNSAEIFGGDAPLNSDFSDGIYIRTGGLFGSAIDISEVSNCSNSGKINSKVIHKHPTYAPDNQVGGLFGNNSSNVNNCSNSGDIYVERSGIVGGLAGVSGAGSKTFTSSVNTGNITMADCCYSSMIGGIAGTNVSSQLLSECINKGIIKVSESDSYENVGSVDVGGIIGTNEGNRYDQTTHDLIPNILNCTNEGKVEVLTSVTYSIHCGGIIGGQVSSMGYVKGCKNIADIISNNSEKSKAFTAGIIGIASGVYIDNCINSGNITGGIGLGDDYYGEVTAAGGIVGMAEQSKIFNLCENAGIVKYNDPSITKNLGSALGYLFNINDDEEYRVIVCTCTKDTSGQGLPMIGGGNTEQIQYTNCPAH